MLDGPLPRVCRQSDRIGGGTRIFAGIPNRGGSKVKATAGAVLAFVSAMLPPAVGAWAGSYDAGLWPLLPGTVIGLLGAAVGFHIFVEEIDK